jgi:hypothetical protein
MPAESMMAEENTGMGMDDSLYADKGDEKESPDEGANESVDEENAENPTALIPLSALGKGAKEGDSITLKVKKIEGEEAVVEIAAGKSEESDTSANDELDTMASNNKGY